MEFGSIRVEKKVDYRSDNPIERYKLSGLHEKQLGTNPDKK
jgi:hypothetical protein